MGNATNAHIVQLRSDTTLVDDLVNMTVSMTVGAEATNAIIVAVAVLSGHTGTAFSSAIALPFYLSSDSAGQVLEAGTDAAITAGTDGLVILNGGDSSVAGTLITETTGEMDLTITDTGADTYYVNVILPNGKVQTSGVVTFAA